MIEFNERTSGKITGTLKDDAGVVVPAATLQVLTLTLFDDDTGTILNSRNAQHVLNANGVTVTAQGVLTWQVTPADTVIVSNARLTELHVAVFQGAWNSGARGFTARVPMLVRNLQKVT